MASGKPKLILDKDEFQSVVDTLESNHTFANKGELWDAVEQTEWAKKQMRPLKAQVAYNRARELGITTKTKAGRKEDFKRTYEPKVVDQQAAQAVLDTFPEPIQRTIKKIKKGSLRAAIKAKCLDCSGLSKKEVRVCPVTNCPLWLVRPFQNKSKTEGSECIQ